MALTLDRYKEESVRIGDDIVITILGIRGTEVKIGIHAPRSVHIVRAEIADKDLIDKVQHLLPIKAKI